MGKVYCKPCKFQEEFHSSHFCKNPATFKIDEDCLYYNVSKSQQRCKDINKNNDCRFFTQKQPSALRKLISLIKK